jgi:hypothetical protein
VDPLITLASTDEIDGAVFLLAEGALPVVHWWICQKIKY